MFKYYILTSNSLATLARQFDTLKINDVVVVINTLDADYEQSAIEFCVKHGIEHYVTESDGTAATGKNSVLKLFLESDNEYFVHVDGDDIITKYGRNLYRTVAMRPDAPDVICLYNQLCLHGYRKGLWDDQYDSRTVKRDGWYIPQDLIPRYPHDYTMDAKHENLSVETIAAAYMRDFSVSQNTAVRWARKRRELNDIYKDHCDRQESFSRIVFFSRKAAKLMHYDNTLRIGEDAYQMHQLRKLAHDGVIDMRTRKERWAFTYVQLADRSSITRNVTSSGDIIINYDWMEPLVDALNKLKPELPIDYSLPEFIDPYYEVNQE